MPNFLSQQPCRIFIISLCKKSCQLIYSQLWRSKIDIVSISPIMNWLLGWMPWSIKWNDSNKIVLLAVNIKCCHLNVELVLCNEILPLPALKSYFCHPFSKTNYTLQVPSPWHFYLDSAAKKVEGKQHWYLLLSIQNRRCHQIISVSLLWSDGHKKNCNFTPIFLAFSMFPTTKVHLFFSAAHRRRKRVVSSSKGWGRPVWYTVRSLQLAALPKYPP